MASQEGTSKDQMVDPGIDRKLEAATIAETLTKLEQCSRFHKMIRDADLEYVLRRRSSLSTLFAPQDEAWPDELSSDPEQFLNRYLLAGRVESFDLRRCKTVKTVAGQVLAVEVNNGTLRIGNATIVRPDIACTNGVIHIMDAPIPP
jgi:transforming growth factor-beta-induced protein